MIVQKKDIAYSGTVPGNYEKYLGPIFFEPFAKELAERISKLRISSILEIASGTGRLTKFLPASTSNAKIIASDVNPAMIVEGKKTLQNLNINIDWKEMDAAEIPFADNSFDCIACQFGVMFFCDKNKALKEIYRTLKPGGTFLFSVWETIDKNPLAKIANDVLSYYFRDNTPPFYFVPYSYSEEVKIMNDLLKAGFSDTSIETIDLIGHSESAKHAAQGLIEGTPVIAAIKERDVSKLPFIMQKLISELSNVFGETDLKVPISAKIISAKKSNGN